MAYLCVNKNGKELICQHKPDRWAYDLNGEMLDDYYLSGADLTFWLDAQYLGEEPYMVETTIELPIGSIKKLIGESLTWEDEPIKLK